MPGELLHAGALAASAVGACCLAADRPAGRLPELAIATVMLAAMTDAVLLGGMLPPVAWAAALILVALAAVLPGGSRTGELRAMRAFDAFGAVLMGALLLAMHPPVASAESHHGTSWGLYASLAVIAAGAYAAAGVVLSYGTGHQRRALTRVPPIAMGLSALLMAIPVAFA